MTLDLVQLRWQQIRAVESSQMLVKENLELKQEIAQLKIKLNHAKSANSGIKMDFLVRIQMQMSSFAMKMKAELTKLKQLHESDVQDLQRSKDLLTKAFDQMKGIVLEKHIEMDVLKKDMKKMEQQLIQCAADLDEKDRLHREHIATVDVKYARQKEEIKELKQKNASLEHDLTQAKEFNSEMAKQKALLEKSLQELEKHSSFLRNELTKLEEMSRQELHDAQESQRRMSEHYEKMIEEMGLENQYLRHHISDLEEQINKLSNAMVGNKSHFAKYVEVKTENMALQTKLEAVLKVKPTYKERLMVAGDSTHTSLPQLPGNKKPHEHKGPEGGLESRSNSSRVPTLPLENSNKEQSIRSHRSRGSSPRVGGNNGPNSARQAIGIGISGAGKKTGRSSFDGLPSNPLAHQPAMNNSQSSHLQHGASSDAADLDHHKLSI